MSAEYVRLLRALRAGETVLAGRRSQRRAERIGSSIFYEVIHRGQEPPGRR